jgi:hypothetical protein
VDEGPIGKRRLPLLAKADLVDDEEDAETEDEDEDEDEELLAAAPAVIDPPEFEVDVIED